MKKNNKNKNKISQMSCFVVGAFPRIASISFKHELKILLLITTLFLTPLSYASDKQTETLLFGMYANENPILIVKKMRPLLNRLETKLSNSLGRPIKIKIDIAPTYSEGIERLASGKVDFSRFGAASYIMVTKKNPDLRVLAVESKKGQRYFKGYICTNADSKIDSLQQLRGNSFAFGGKESTVGRFLAQYTLYEAGIEAKSLAGYEYLGRHDKVANAVANGRFTAGAFKGSTYRKSIKKGLSLKVLHTFKTPTKPWLASSQLDQELVNGLQDILLNMDANEVKKIYGKDGFLSYQHEQFETLKQAITANHLFFDGQVSD